MANSGALELTLVSARDLKDVNFFTKMDVYAVVSLVGDRLSSQRTPSDRDGGKNPSWNATFRFPLPSDPTLASRLVIHILLRSERALGDREVGEVQIPLKELLDGDAASVSAATSAPRFLSFQVLKPSSGKAKGVLNISYRFIPAVVSEKIAAPVPPVAYPAPVSQPPAGYPPMASSYTTNQDEPAIVYPTTVPEEKPSALPVSFAPPASVSEKAKKYHEPVVAYPAASVAYPAAYAAYPPLGAYRPYGVHPYGYYLQPASAGGYGYPPLAPGYGYAAPPPPPAPKKSSNLGAGLGMGLLGGALGGLLIGDLVSDAAAYDAGYDDGFDQGFDDGDF